LDDRYFNGLSGQYYFQLHFRLDKDGEHDYIVRSHGNYSMRRSVSTDLELDPGTYSVLMKITATRYKDDPTPEDVIRSNVRSRQNKLIQVGLSYDLAHAKGMIRETEAEKQDRRAREEKKIAAEKKKQRELKRKQKLADWDYENRNRARNKRQAEKREAYQRRKAAKAEAAEPAEGSVTGDASTPTVSGATAAAGVEGQIEQQAAAGAVEPKTGESAPDPDPASLPSPPAEARSANTKAPNGTATAETNPDSTTEAPSKEQKPADEPTPTTTSAAAASEKSQQFEKALKSIPSVTINGEPAPPSSAPVPPQSTAAPSTLAPNDDYQYDSDASFDGSIDSVLDFPREPITSLDDNEDGNADDDADLPPEDEEVNKEFEDDPWNAVCVVGLRVYSKDEGCCVEVVRPKTEEETLDLDDVSKGASGEVEGEGDGVGGVQVEVDTRGVKE